MTLSYSLHLITNMEIQEVLKFSFNTENVERLPQVIGVMYTRGSVFLAHGRETDAKNKLRFQQNFEFNAEVSISFFPDGVSSVNSAMDILLNAVLRWINETDDSILLVSNNRDLTLMRCDETLRINEQHPYWIKNRLARIEQPYTAWQTT